MQCTIIDEYFVNLAKIIGGNSPQSIHRSQLAEYLPRALIDWFDVPGTTNGTSESKFLAIPSRFSDSTNFAFLALAAYYIYNSTPVLPTAVAFTKSFVTGSMSNESLPSGLDARIAAAVMEEQVVARITAAIIAAIRAVLAQNRSIL